MPQKNEIVIWSVNTTSYEDIDRYVKILSGEEKTRASKFRFKKDRYNFILGRAILRILIGRYIQKPADEIRFQYNTFGKPSLADPNSGLTFNISHSEAALIIGFSKDHPIGVDVEKIKDNFDVLEIAQNYFSPYEIRLLRDLSKREQYKAFYRCWTRKESFIKAKGEGLSFPLDKFSVSLDNDDKASLIETKWDLKEKDSWKMFSFTPSKGYIAAVAVHGPKDSIRYYPWSPEL